jgi:hypothetical protein
MRHEIRYALEHAPGFEEEGREGNFVKVQADSGELVISRRPRASIHGGNPTVVVK